MSAYDQIADIYDQLFSDDKSLQENCELFDLLNWKSGETVLDIGCGTGLFWEYNTPEIYIGLDPSDRMLANFAAKFPQAEGCLKHCKFEDYVGAGADLVIALFGAASYIRPSAVSKIAKLTNPGGRYFVMFFGPGYSPVVNGATNLSIKHFMGSEALLPGKQTVFNNYTIVTGAVSAQNAQTEPDNAAQSEPDSAAQNSLSELDRPASFI